MITDSYFTFNEISKNQNIFDIFEFSQITSLFIYEKIIIRSSDMTKLFLASYGDRYFFKSFNDYITAYTEIKSYISLIDFKYLYKYKKLIKTLNFEYNPIWNKDATRTNKITRTPNLTTENSSNQTSNEKNTNTNSSNITEDQTTTPNLTTTNKTTESKTETPNLTTTTTNPATTVTHSTSPYDTSNTLYNEYADKTEIAADTQERQSGTNTEKTDSTITTTQTGTSAAKNTTAATTTGTVENTTTNTNSGMIKESGTEVTIEEFTENGNIGVTSTQGLIKAERNVANFSVINEFLNDVITEIGLDIYKI